MGRDRKLIQIREFDPAADYALVCSWWEAHGWKPVPAEILPKLGMVVYFETAEGQQDACAAWLYMDNSGVGVCWLEWLVTNPKNKGTESLRAISTMTDFMKIRAREMNYGVMMTTARQASLVRVHERNGFAKTDEGVTHLISLLN